MDARKEEAQGWDKIYLGIDIHETILEPTWSKELSTVYYPYAKETLQMMSLDSELCLILWSCSLPEFNDSYRLAFLADGIEFKYINSNPEVKSTHYADFESKLYFNVGLDDKFGFIPEEDWKCLYEFMKTRMKEW